MPPPGALLCWVEIFLTTHALFFLAQDNIFVSHIEMRKGYHRMSIAEKVELGNAVKTERRNDASSDYYGRAPNARTLSQTLFGSYPLRIR
jgi:hypothetical protein